MASRLLAAFILLTILKKAVRATIKVSKRKPGFMHVSMTTTLFS
ncbi:MAG: hypothetical protein QW208_07605 [Acidilobaceae archaeon]